MAAQGCLDVPRQMLASNPNAASLKMTKEDCLVLFTAWCEQIERRCADFQVQCGLARGTVLWLRCVLLPCGACGVCCMWCVAYVVCDMWRVVCGAVVMARACVCVWWWCVAARLSCRVASVLIGGWGDGQGQ